MILYCKGVCLMSKTKTIVFAVDNNYVAYLYACLKSLIKHISQSDAYSIYVLHTTVSDINIENIMALQQKNIKITFVNMHDFITQELSKTFVVNSHFTPETYYRFFLPNIFPNLDKVLYLDADMLIFHDIKPLFDIDLSDCYLAATHDYEVIRIFNSSNNPDVEYFSNVLGVSPEKYFQAGVMMLNLKKMRQDNVTTKLIECLHRIKAPKFVDQDVLNVVCQNNVRYIPVKWDCLWHFPFTDDQYALNLGKKCFDLYEEAIRSPYIVHFTGKKPTEYQNTLYSKIFFEYHAGGPYHEWLCGMLKKNHKKQLRLLNTYRNKIIKYRLLKWLCLGCCNEKYESKISNRKRDIKNIYKYCINS